MDVLKTLDLDELQQAMQYLVKHRILTAPKLTAFMKQLACSHMSAQRRRPVGPVQGSLASREFRLLAALQSFRHIGDALRSV